MSIDSKKAFTSCFAVLVAGIVSTIFAAQQNEKSYRDYPEWNMFPRGFDMEDEAAVRRYDQLVEQGESAYEALMAVVRECDDYCVVSTALSILRESQGNKCAVVEELKEIFAGRLSKNGDDNQEMLIFMAEALANLGTEDDLDVLFPMLSRPEWRVRFIGTQCLGKRGGQRALKALEQVQGRDANNRVNAEIVKAISAIECRQAEKAASQQADASPSP